MSIERPLLVLLAVACALPQAPAADACGPDFPVELLSSRRADVMAELPEGVFADEVAKLVPAPGPYRYVPGPEVMREADPDAPVESPPAGASAIELALYAQGVTAWRRGVDGATAAFEQVLALPPDQRRYRSVRAAYMLARFTLRGRVEAFRRVRALVDAGFVDDDGLAAASLGQEGRALLVRDDVGLALQRFAEQAAVGHPRGAFELLATVREAIGDGAEGTLAALPLGQHVLTAYLYCRGDELDAAVRDRVIATLLAQPRVAGLDRLAAARYRDGAWDEAARLLARAAPTPLASWVGAKLALRAGDRAAATARLDDAAVRLTAQRAACPDADVCPDRAAQVLVEGERLITAVRDGRMVDAMRAAWATRTTYRDVSYVADRLLTVDELRAFVAALPPDDDETVWMRDVLGRRLMRAGRHREALPFLAAAHRGAAITYGAMRETAAAATDPIAQAEALFRASLVARHDGMEVLGTEHAPDWAVYGGVFDPTNFADEAPPDPAWSGAIERARLAASAPAFRARYHYRYLASQLAEEAADLLPHRSQAFAATLCWSARHVRNTDEDRVQRLWRRQVDDGPLVYDMDFGITCPAPAFAAARRFALRSPVQPRPPPWWLLAPAGLACALAAGVVLMRRRQRRFAARP